MHPLTYSLHVCVSHLIHVVSLPPPPLSFPPSLFSLSVDPTLVELTPAQISALRAIHAKFQSISAKLRGSEPTSQSDVDSLVAVKTELRRLLLDATPALRAKVEPLYQLIVRQIDRLIVAVKLRMSHTPTSNLTLEQEQTGKSADSH